MKVNFCISLRRFQKKKAILAEKKMYPSNSHSNLDIVIVIINIIPIILNCGSH